MEQGKRAVIAALRERGWSLKELHRRIGRPGGSTVRHWLRGRQGMPLGLVVDVAGALDIPAREIASPEQRLLLSRLQRVW